MNGSKLPHWDLTPIYPSFTSKEYLEAKKNLVAYAQELQDYITKTKMDNLSAWLKKAIELINKTYTLGETLGSFCYSQYSVNTRSSLAMNELNAIEETNLLLKACDVAFKNAIATKKADILSLIKTDKELSQFAFFFTEELFLQSKQMSPDMEELAQDLTRSGGDAWGRLQETISSTASIIWDENTGEKKTVIELRNMAYDSDRSIREKAFKKELEIWKSVEIPIAAALNGVKGFTVALNKRRAWESAIEKSIAQARITDKTLKALTQAMEDALPIFRRYLSAKAKLLGFEKCAFFDLFAPVGDTSKIFTWDESKNFIIEKFTSFSKEMGAFAKKAFDNNWIDAEPRDGKVGGAYCIGFPGAKASRIMCNFEGSYSSVTTVAHELGHAYHGEVLKDLPQIQTQYPMTLAETASIFAETVVFEEALSSASDEEKISLIELHLQDGTQILVDILSRYYFEEAVFEQRKTRELSPDEFSQLMIDAQKKTYGSGLDENNLHPYMWAVKGHYYSTGLSYYNYPYAFGQLFGLGLYSLYKKEGSSFAQKYAQILKETGRASAVEVTKQAGFDIETKAFWQEGISVFEREVEEFEKLVEKKIKK